MPLLGAVNAITYGRICPPQYPYRHDVLHQLSGANTCNRNVLLGMSFFFALAAQGIRVPVFPCFITSPPPPPDCPNLQTQLVTSTCVKLKATLCFFATVSLYGGEDASAGAKGLLCKRTSRLLARALDVQLYLLQVVAHRHCLPAAAWLAFVHTTTIHALDGEVTIRTCQPGLWISFLPVSGAWLKNAWLCMFRHSTWRTFFGTVVWSKNTIVSRLQRVQPCPHFECVGSWHVRWYVSRAGCKKLHQHITDC
jgi:hypothetical protein